MLCMFIRWLQISVNTPNVNVLVISQYKHDILVIIQAQGKAEDEC